LAQVHTGKLHPHLKLDGKRQGGGIKEQIPAQALLCAAERNQTLRKSDLLPVILWGTVALQDTKADNIHGSWRMLSSARFHQDHCKQNQLPQRQNI